MIAEFIKMGKVEFAVCFFSLNSKLHGETGANWQEVNDSRCLEKKSTMSAVTASSLTAISRQRSWIAEL